MSEATAVPLFDTHTHLNTEAFASDLAAVLERARSQGVERMLVVGFDLPSSRAAVALTREAGLYAAVGIQPHYAGEIGPHELEELRCLAQEPGVVALGEIGLDYYRDRAPRHAQRELLRQQLSLALELGLPVVIHARDAFAELLAELREAGPGLRGVMHCFSGSPLEAQEYLELGLFLSIAGPVTYPRATRLAEVVRLIPSDRLLLETDCPWLAPQRYRGTRNEPAYLPEIARQVAALRGESLNEVARVTTRNARTLFRV